MQRRVVRVDGDFVCSAWQSFYNFKAWMENQDWEDKELDKDLLVPGNKMYSPETCMFVPRSISRMVRPSAKPTKMYGLYCSRKKKIRFNAFISLGGQDNRLGEFDTEEEARAVWGKAKADYFREVADLQTRTLRDALYRHAELLEKPQVIA